LVLAKGAVSLLQEGVEPFIAAQKAIGELEQKVQSTGGIILIDRHGRIGYARNTTHMPVCFIANNEGFRFAS
jgi:beta-aspartyl-peptidase (threonine type)